MTAGDPLSVILAAGRVFISRDSLGFPPGLLFLGLFSQCHIPSRGRDPKRCLHEP
jgi:hypothetical protein